MTCEIDTLCGGNLTINIGSTVSLTPNRVVITDGAGALSTSSTTASELSFLTGVTSNIQAQLDARALRTLNNLSSVAINASLLPDITNTINLGSASKLWDKAHLTGSILYGSTSGNVTLLAADTTTSYSVKWPSAQSSGTRYLQNDGSGNLSWATVVTAAITSINTDTTAAQTLVVGTSGTDFAIVDNLSGTHTFNLPTASGSARGALSSADWTTFNSKQNGDPTLTALAAYNTNGLMTQTAADTFTGRTITGSSSITVTNGNGVSGNPTLSVIAGGVSHNSLADLTTGDVHTQYAFLNGRSGGQTLTGGTAASNSLTLISTSNATKGNIVLGTASAYDQLNDRLGIGTLSPSVKIHQDGGNATATYHKFTAGTTTGTTSTDGFDIGIASNGVAEFRQREALDAIFYCDNTEVFAMTPDLKMRFGPDGFIPCTIQLGRNLSLDSGDVYIDQIILPNVTMTNNVSFFYGLAIQPQVSGTGSSTSTVGAYFAVSANNQGGGDVAGGCIMDVEANGSTPYDTVYGIRAQCSADDVGTLRASALLVEPIYLFSPEKTQALVVQGTWGVDESENTATGTQNALAILSSYMIFTNATGPTINGIFAGRSGKRVLMVFKNGATITHNSGSAAAGDKIFTNTGSNITITGTGAVEFVYSATDSVWYVISALT